MADGKGYVLSFIRQSVLSPVVYDASGNEEVLFSRDFSAYNTGSTYAGPLLPAGKYLAFYDGDLGTGTSNGIIGLTDDSGIAANEVLPAFIEWYSRNNSNVQEWWGGIYGQVADTTNGSEDAYVSINLMEAGSVQTQAQFRGGGISFDSGSNVLDDYETGSWTPSITFGGGSTGITYSGRDGSYTKIGNRVFCHGYANTTSKGTSTGEMKIEGLPFTIQGDGGAGCWQYYSGFTGLVSGAPVLDGQGTTTTYKVAEATANTQAGMTNSDCTNTMYLYFELYYEV